MGGPVHVLVGGGGGREHALAWKIQQSPLVTRLSVSHDNPGFPADAGGVDGDLVRWCRKEAVDLVMVGPEAPLAEGLVDRLQAEGIDACGPSAGAARLESSKAFAKEFMDRHGIPTARWSVHTDAAAAHAAITGPCVIKADGLAAGKGVIVAQEAAEAHAAVDEIFGGRFGEAGAAVLVEELLVGPEVSFIALCDGRRAVPLRPCRDHKRRFEGDAGPNTGGMGAICPVPDLPAGAVEQVLVEVLQPVVDGMAAEGHPFRGVLYAGVMWTADGPKVLEFNVRFGDPECQPLMVMLAEDVIPWLRGAARGDLPAGEPRWHEGASCCVVMVSQGYPGAYPKGRVISGLADGDGPETVVFQAGTRREDGGQLQTNGGRVLGVTARASSLEAARRAAYARVGTIHFDGAAWRRDIGGPILGRQTFE